jgi:ADP-ribose pyrophosphatase YjhB (NUDIX family)
MRNSAKAIIIADGHLLTMKAQDQWGPYFLLPGGGQEFGETIHEALRRECMEEISAEVEIGELVFVREYIGRNHEFAEFDADFHQVECMFRCSLAPGAEPAVGLVPDKDQVGVEWIPLSQIMEYRLYPRGIREALTQLDVRRHPVYFGDIN